jgi:hypothetical protein
MEIRTALSETMEFPFPPPSPHPRLPLRPCLERLVQLSLALRLSHRQTIQNVLVWVLHLTSCAVRETVASQPARGAATRTTASGGPAVWMER